MEKNYRLNIEKTEKTGVGRSFSIYINREISLNKLNI